MGWIPPSLKQKEFHPEGVRTFGGPWIWRTSPGAYRYGPVSWPFWGFGQFLIGIRGTALVMSWPMSVISDLAVQAEQGIEVMSLMPRHQFNAQIAGFFHTLVRPGQAVWIPFGHCPMYIALPEDTELSSNFMVSVPFMSPKLLNALSDSDTAMLQSTFKRYALSSPIKNMSPWSTIGPAMLTWLGLDDMGNDDDDEATSEVDSDPNDTMNNIADGQALD